jgi:predicted membrane channel-forming protein YqfA (hemolysin III family)
MNKPEKTFRDKLLDIEKTTDSYKEKYEKEVQAMVEKKLTGANKWFHVGGLIMGLGFLILFATIAVIMPKEFPFWGRTMFILGAVFGAVFAAFEGWILKKGTIDLRKDEMASAGLSWGVVVIAATIVLVNSGKLADPIKGVHMLVGILVFEVMAAVGLLKAIIQRSELNNREKLLEIEYRIAELAEKIDGKPNK